MSLPFFLPIRPQSTHKKSLFAQSKKANIHIKKLAPAVGLEPTTK